MRSMLLLVAVSGGLYGQGERGSITGVIKDRTDAPILNVRVVAANLQTNVETQAVTTDSGVYRIPYLPPGNYRVSAMATGFKKAVIEPLVVPIAGVVTANLTLDVGDVAESVTVSAEATLLETSSSEVGRNIGPAEFHTWPIIVDDGQRQLQNFIFKSLPGAVGEPWQGSINGGQYFSHEIMIEGMSLGRFDINGGANAEFSPSADTVSEFKLQTGALGAQYGGTQTSIANFNIRSGTNAYHGTLYEYFKNDKLNATPFLNNSFGRDPVTNRPVSPKAPVRENSFGLTAGGPVMLPKLYSGRNKTFFFFSYEGDRRRSYSVGGFRNLPTAAFKRGDFSRLLDPKFTGNPRSGTQAGVDALNRPVIFGAIYDPRSTRTVDGRFVRDPFPGNIVPPDKFSTVARNILQMAPVPDPLLDSFVRNYPSTPNQPKFLLNSWGGKLDHVFNQSHRMAVFVNFNERDRFNGASNGYAPIPGSATGPYARQIVNGTLIRLTEDWVISPRLLNHFGIGYNRFLNYNNTISLDQDWPQKIGLKGLPGTHFPQLEWQGPEVQGGRLVRLGRSTAGVGGNGSSIVANDTTYIRGSHTFKFGAEVRKYYYNSRERGSTSGRFTFGPDQTAEPNFRTQTGFSFASFMLGAPRQTRMNIVTTTPGYRILYPAFYVTDDWKATRKLTFNLGLRWEIVGALHEVANRMSGLDPSKANPGADGYPGALVFLADLGRDSFQETNWREFGPRVGFAYQISSRMVARGGYGINYSAPISNNFGFDNIFGFNGSNNRPAATRNPVFYWDDGYPAFTGVLPNKNPALQNGGGVSYTAPDSTRQPYAQNWSFGFQWLLPSQVVLETSYIGNKGTRLSNGSFQTMQQVDPRFLSLGNALLDDLGSHPEIRKPYPSFDGTVAQALRPFPQYDGAYNQFPYVGNSRYDSLQIQATKRLGRGLSFLAAYTFSKTISDSDDALKEDGNPTSVQDVYNRRLERSVTSFHYPNNFKLTWVYEFPFGKGRRYLTRGVGNILIGGWTLTGIHNYRSGDPLNISTNIDTTAVLYNGAIRGDVIPGAESIKDAGGLDVRNGTPYLNPAAFRRPPTSSSGVPLRLGTAPRYLPNVRGPKYTSEDFGLMKRFLFTETVNLEFRADAFNALNRAGRGNPDTNLDSSTFGRILAPAYGPRTIQLELRFNY
jgi:hypothetical protein